MTKWLILILFSTASYAAPLKKVKSPKVKSYLTSIGELCEKSNGCKIELVPKNMKVHVGSRSLLVLNDKYQRLDGDCINKRYCKIVIKSEPVK